jgi:pentalenolactone synthase
MAWTHGPGAIPQSSGSLVESVLLDGQVGVPGTAWTEAEAAMTTVSLPHLPFERPGVLDVPPLYRTLRDTAPVTPVRTPVGDVAWLVTGYTEARTLFADPRLGRSHPTPESAARISGAAFLGGPMGDAATEEEDHNRTRRLLAPAFSARRMNALRSRVAELVDGLLDDLADSTPPADLHEALSFPLPVLVICELLGVPYDDRDQFRRWSQQVGGLYDRDAAMAALDRLSAYMLELITRKRTDPGEDVISDLVAVQSDWDLADQSIASLCAALLFAGHETTVTRIDFGVLLLLDNPDQREALRRDPAKVDGAVEEILRMAAPSSSAGLVRYAHTDIDIAGVRIRTGDAVLLSSAAANRDPAAFADPDTFDIAREPGQHLTFGYGSRYCIGASLARIELQEVFAALLRRFPTLRLAVAPDQLQLRTDLLTGGLAALPVTWTTP